MGRSEMYFFEGGICITTPAHSLIPRPPPPLHIRSRAHPFTTYLDVKLLDVKAHYLDVKMRGVFVYWGECDPFYLLSILSTTIQSDIHHLSNPAT
jgi:hypothetical protein